MPSTGKTTSPGSGAARQQRYDGLGSGKTRGTGRVISRSGVEFDDTPQNSRGMRVREVSGKVAEEGRGDRMWRERGGARF